MAPRASPGPAALLQPLLGGSDACLCLPAAAGVECGLGAEGFRDWAEGDQIQVGAGPDPGPMVPIERQMLEEGDQNRVRVQGLPRGRQEVA